VIVVDSSALVRSLTDDRELGNKARAILSLHEEWAAPSHLTAEFIHALRGMVRGEKIELDRAEWALREYFDLGIRLIVPDAAAVDRAWKLRHNLSAYDALYVAIAEQLGYPLLTSDARVEASGAAHCEIKVIRPDA
jgi:predicted nucleic acid-binding protein